MTYHLLNGRGYDHVTIFKFCRDAVRRLGSGFISDSWYLLLLPLMVAGTVLTAICLLAW